MKTRLFLMALALAAAFGGLFGWKAYMGAQMQAAMTAAGPPIMTVSTTRVTTTDWEPVIQTVATLRASQAVDVTAQVAGQITALYFESGEQVERGAALLQQYEADDRARLKALQADRRLAEIELERARELVTEKLVSQAELDTAESRMDRIAAEVESLEVEIAKKRIRAPFAGRLGIRQVNLGQYIEPGDAIVRLEADQRLFADFRLPQQAAPQVGVGQLVKLTVDAWPGETFDGRIAAIDPAVDRNTRNLNLRADLTNNDGRLQPGMFATIRVQLPRDAAIIAVPQTAIRYSPYGESVFLVDAVGDGLADVRSVLVTTGKTRGDLVAIDAGLRPGQEIVTAGQHKLRDGARVRVDNKVPVASNPDPDPPES
ncbi:MAG: efflux RND transporter periplasmic adaptor subunit [Gammaproteobacteria bacterium]|nr:efflux RND transporter periplasmic adaptor subunit [Gammaproteobacteria bacterium]